jgi:hypothetical protein
MVGCSFREVGLGKLTLPKRHPFFNTFPKKAKLQGVSPRQFLMSL